MEILEEFTLSNKGKCRLLRLITPSKSPVPEEIVRYMIASLGFDYYRKYINDQNYWRLYYRSAFDGEGAIDHFYFAEVEGVLAARIWFGYDPISGFGNFGNVYTEPNYRKLGLMSKLLIPCVRDFLASNAKLLCCYTGSPTTEAAYKAFGFQVIYGGETGPMCLINPKYGTHFLEIEKKVFDSSSLKRFRLGTAGDQFPCDKFLAYCSKLINIPQGRGGADSFVTDYRTAYQEYKNGNGVVCVAENGTGNVSAWAYAVKAYGSNCLNFTIHPDNAHELKKLLDFTVTEFNQLFPGEKVNIYLKKNFNQQMEALKSSGYNPSYTILDNEGLNVFEL